MPLTTEHFVVTAKGAHGDHYDYSNSEYIPGRKIEIICPTHGSFWQTPYSHIQGHGCSKCAGNATRTKAAFVSKAQQTHNDRYDYSQAEYVNNGTKIEIICSTHGSFWQTPKGHLNGNGCPDCGLPSDMDAVYVWRLLEYPEQHGRLCYKVGVTSERLGIERIEYVGRFSGYTPVDVRVFNTGRAVEAETLLMALGESAQLTGFSGATECRLFTPDEYRQALAICRNAGAEIEVKAEADTHIKDAPS